MWRKLALIAVITSLLVLATWTGAQTYPTDTAGDAVYTLPANTPMLLDVQRPWKLCRLIEAGDLPDTTRIDHLSIGYVVIKGDGLAVGTLERTSDPYLSELIITSLGGGSYVIVIGIPDA